MLPALYTLSTLRFDLRATHARTLLPAALASVSFGFVLVRVRVRVLACLEDTHLLCAAANSFAPDPEPLNRKYIARAHVPVCVRNVAFFGEAAKARPRPDEPLLIIRKPTSQSPSERTLGRRFTNA